MGQKDLSSKQLEGYPDVFADILNVLVYEGKQAVSEEQLEPAPTETLYRSKNGDLRNQFHDVSKYQVVNGKKQVQYTLENEVSMKRKTILRKVGYSGAVYREQYERKEEYPFVGLLLYWGKGKWKQPVSLHELFANRMLSEELWEFVDEFKLHVYNMRSLPKKIRVLFKSDMRLVVDYLAEGMNYIPGKQKVRHVEAFLNMMHEITGDDRYLNVLGPLLEAEKEGVEITMCEILDGFIEKGISQGISQGENHFAKLMENLFQDNRLEDAKRVTTDEKRRKELYREYGLI